MNNFIFDAPTKIIFGKNQLSTLLYEIRNYGNRVLFVTGGGSAKKSGLYEKVAMQLREANKMVVELSGVQPNPRLALVRKGIELVKRNNIDFILALGGGSVIDTAKAISFGAVEDEDVWDIITKGLPIHKALPIGVVLTIAAAGSESSDSCVISNDELGLKCGIHNTIFRPKFAILDPEITYSLGKYQTGCGCVDILSHLMERYFTPDTNNDLTTNLLIGAMKTVIKYAPIAYNDPNNYEARAEIMYTGTIAHNNSLSVGRPGDWACHKMEYALSAITDVAHGEGLAILTPAWMKYVYKENPELFARLAVELFGFQKGDTPDEQLTYLLIAKLEEFYKSLGMRLKLRDLGIEKEQIDDYAELTMYGHETIGGLKVLKKEDVVEILNLCY